MNQAAIDQKRKDYEAFMRARNGEPRTQITGEPCPFGEYSLTDFIHEVTILEVLGKAWDMKFCQATMGFMRRAGGLWLAYDKASAPKAIIHPEQFVGKFMIQTELNFWTQHLLTGIRLAGDYGVPFVVVAQFDDGRYSVKWQRGEREPSTREVIGSRILKGAGYDGVVNMVTYIPSADFKRIDKPRENTDQTSD